MSRSANSSRLPVPRDARVRRVLLAYGMSRFTEFAGWLALLLVAYEWKGAIGVGIASVVMQLPAIVAVPLLASVGDRIPRGRALTLSHACVAVGAAVTGLVLAMGAPLWVVLVGGTVTTVAVYLVRPMHFAVLPLLASGPGDLVAANGWSSFMEGTAVFVGFVLAGVLTHSFGAWSVLAICAVLGALATLLTRGLSTPVMAVADGDAPSEIRAALDGVVALRRNAGALTLLLLMACVSVLQGSNEALTVTFNDEVLGLSESTAGLIAGAFGVGIAIGGITLTSIARRPRLAPVVLAGAVVIGLGQCSVALLGTLGPVVAVLVVVGFGMAMVVVSARTLLQRTTDDAVLARVLAVQEGVHLTGLTVGAVVGPLVIVAFGPTRAFLPVGVLIGTIGLLSHRSIRRLDSVAAVHPREIALLSGVPFLAALPAYELERLAQGARWVTVPAGTVVVTQGDPADSYYLVASGELAVTIDGRVREHFLAAGDGFGEIALLHRVLRTATITAVSDCELLVVDSQRFLAAVTSSPDGSALAHQTSQQRLASGGGREPDAPEPGAPQPGAPGLTLP